MSNETMTRIAQIVSTNDVTLFMKGTAFFPQCGFSSKAIAILDHLGVAYETVDVLQDPEVRQGIKAFSDWPTIPQLYVKGEFIGGSDIMMEMYEVSAYRLELGWMDRNRHLLFDHITVSPCIFGMI
jgi:monothiol glutaredoxin